MYPACRRSVLPGGSPGRHGRYGRHAATEYAGRGPEGIPTTDLTTREWRGPACPGQAAAAPVYERRSASSTKRLTAGDQKKPTCPPA
jgi:hypothetical protein